MSLTDPLGDMLTRIRNAYGRNKSIGVDAGFDACAPACSTC